MEQHANPESAASPDPSIAQTRVDDLHMRIEALERLGESEIGEFSRRDWALCILGAIVIPGLVLLWFGR